MVVEKQNTDAKFWPRLQKQPGKLSFVKTDFSKYKDEDEDDDEPAVDPQAGMNAQLAQMMSGMPGMGGMSGMGGMPGMGGMDPAMLEKVMANSKTDVNTTNLGG